MKSRASAKEEKKEGHNITNHGGYGLKRHSLWFIIFMGVVFFLGRPVFAQAEVKRVTLDNGMIILLKEKHNLPLVDFFLCIPSGSAQEGKFASSGISHFIEHMVFKGTSSRKVGAVFKEIESYGGKINALTSYDYTGYKVTVPSEFAFPALEILADMLMNATFDSGELEKERAVVLKEIKLNYDSPQRYASQLLWQTVYSAHPYKYPILGEEELFKGLAREDLLESYRVRYTPNNMVLAVVGDVRAPEFLNFTRELFKNFQRSVSPDFKNEPEPEQKELRKYEEEFSSGLTYLFLGFHSVAITDEDLFALDVLATVLGEGESSRLYKLICGKKKLAYNIGAANYTPREAGVFIISSLLEEGHRRRALSLILKQLSLIRKKKVSEDELESAKNKIVSGILFHNQTLEAQAQDLALNEALTGNFAFTEKYIQEVSQVNAQDILDVANKYLRESNLSIVALTPRSEVRGLGSPERSNESFTIGVENLTRQTDETLSVEKYILDNGITLLVKENKDLPLVAIKAVFKGGLRAEDENTNGLCDLVVKMLDKGTGTKNAEEIAFLVESKGARLSSFSGNNSLGLALDLLSQDFDEMLALLMDLLANSTFPKKEFKREKEKSSASLRTQEDDIFASGTKLLKSTLFEKHPYRFLSIGSERSLKNLRRRDLINFYQDFCVGKNMVLVVFGDVDPREVLVKVKRLSKEIKPGLLPNINPEEEPKRKSVRKACKSLPKKQSLVLIGFHGSTVFSKDRYVLEVICQILSQPSGRLFTQIRERTGSAYTLGAYSVLGLDPGYIVIYVATLAKDIETVKAELFQQIRLLQQNPISEEELAQVKRALLSKKMIERQTNAASALESSLDELYGLGCNNYLEYADQISRIESKDIIRCAKQFFDLTNYADIIIGAD